MRIELDGVVTVMDGSEAWLGEKFYLGSVHL